MRKPVIYILLPFICLQILIAYLSVGYPFFWDNVLQASTHAHFYYENNFSHLLLPDALDPGHPPLMGMYLAVVWKIWA